MALADAQKTKITEEETFRAQVRETVVPAATQKYGMPALLSFFIPGLGQIVKGQVGKGVGILLGYFFSWILIITIIGAVVPLIIWVWQIYDAYNSPASQ
jgi:TM2 domain-containing membrane protein YozV